MEIEAILVDVAAIFEARAETHGGAEETHEAIAGLWSGYLGQEVQPHEVAVCMASMKIARIKGNPNHRDSYIDAIAYLAIAACLAGVSHDQ